ncbi:uncharacterized protein KD926_008389 [Aspergillus affinis]|uniref:uncharacterized protein n=1 Tax=Aspergillus affinis TaxID=1070780 RepID=UPI0022FE292E|nr:uncharacterized protein KD926_008389 [Aspergillus affinis]KAI9040299.1 hypothetical protein KD926_008389 [Aspergillus affinis]
MSDIFVPQQPVIISQNTRASFTQYLHEHPSSRRISPTEKENLIEWLTNPEKRPSSQREFSRRNYARKTFIWGNETQDLLAINKTQEGGNRIVVAEDRIAETVEFVHNRNGHAGWDATWKDVSTSYYGILRAFENIITVDPDGFDLLNPQELEDATLSPLRTDSPNPPNRQY